MKRLSDEEAEKLGLLQRGPQRVSPEEAVSLGLNEPPLDQPLLKEYNNLHSYQCFCFLLKFS